MIGTVLHNRYRITHFLAEGGMSRIYVARQLDRDRDVAVKVSNATAVDPRELRAQVQREVQLMARFRHPFAVALYDVVLEDELPPCLVMELVRGETLAKLLDQHGRLPPDRVGRLLGQLACVLMAAHEQGLVYRDLKPANVMVVNAGTPNESIKVLDLGLARLSGACFFTADDLNKPRPPLSGTPEYLCPEEIRREPSDHRADIYSLGIMLFELLTGVRPFDRPTVAETLDAHVRDRPLRFADVGADHVPLAIRRVVAACLAKHPDDRPWTALDVAQAYETALGAKILVDEASLPPVEEVSLPDLTGPLTEQPDDPNTVCYLLTAWMPEQIAVMKLRGCLPDIGGAVADSAPGYLRIDLRYPPAAPLSSSPPGMFEVFFGLSKKKKEASPPPAVMELRMENSDPKNPAMLAIEVVMRPPAGNGQADGAWRAYCERVATDLSAYLMAKKEAG